MKKNKIIGFAAAAMALALNGCSLALPDAGEDGSADRLIGVFITADYLDLFDMDSYLKDHTSKLLNNQEITVTDTTGYQNRLYADIDKSGGEEPSSWQVTFGNVSGINFFSPVCESADGDTYRGSICGEGISDTNISLNTSDTGNEYSLTGTVYILPGQMDQEIAYFPNPVFQTASGDIYTVSGQGYSTSGDSADGICFTTQLKEEKTITENGAAKTEQTSVTLNVATMHIPVEITLYQINGSHQILKKETYVPGTLPDELSVEPDTAYLLVETKKETLYGEIYFSREICEYDELSENILQTYYPLDNGVAAVQDTEVDWGRES